MVIGCIWIYGVLVSIGLIVITFYLKICGGVLKVVGTVVVVPELILIIDSCITELGDCD